VVVVTLVTGDIVTCAGAAPDGRHCLSPGGTKRRIGACESDEEAIDGGCECNALPVIEDVGGFSALEPDPTGGKEDVGDGRTELLSLGIALSGTGRVEIAAPPDCLLA
jgi:hypothetical protein